MTDTRCDVVVVGAGFSGLACARALAAAGVDVRVCEARNRVGGRAKPGMLAGRVVDLGGQWLGAKHLTLAALAQEHGVRAFPQHARGKRVLEYDGRVRGYRGLISGLPLASLFETGLAVWRLDRMARSLPSEAPWSARHAGEWDAQSVEDWKRRNV